MVPPARPLTPPWALGPLPSPAHWPATAHPRRSTAAHTPAARPSSRPALTSGSGTRPRTRAGPGAAGRRSGEPARRLPCSPRSMSEPPRSRRSARRAPPRRAAPRSARAVPTPGVGAALPGAGPGRHRPPDRNLCAPPRRRGRRRRTGARGGSGKAGEGLGGRGKGDGEAGPAAASRWRWHFTPKFATRKVSSPALALRLPLSPPLCTCWRGNLFARWSKSFG